ncbi:MAG: condensation domain-containing protein, partial [Acidobacteriota bacterium]
LREAVAALEVHHDALRLRARRRVDTWQPRQSPPSTESTPPVVAIDAAIEPLADACARLQAGLDLYRGPIHRLALIDGVSEAGDQRLLWVIHHLAIDGVSWRILLEDLERTLDRIERREAIELPPKTSSVRAWAERLEARAAERSELADQVAIWRALPMPTPLPADGPDAAPERDVVSAVSTCRTTLDDAVTGRLVETLGALGLGVQAAVLTTLARVLAPVLDGAPLTVDLEGHGRGLDIEELDTTRTVGWLTSLFPFVVDTTGRSPVDDLARIDRALAAVPDGGLGFGRLPGTGYADDPGSDGDRPLAPVLFNYLGRLDASFADSTRFTRAPESPGPRRDPSTPRGHALEINTWIEGGRLCAEWLHGPRHAVASVAAWADALGERLGRLAVTLADGAEVRYPLAGLDAEALATLDELVPRPADQPLDAVVETVWPLAPLQRGIFFHALYEPVGEAYFEQIACRIDGALDRAALHRLCADTLARHPALRAAFVHRGLDQPVQVIHRADTVELPWHEVDWRDRTTTANDIERFLAEDRRRGFALDRAPLCRVHLLRVDERSWVFVWSYHHLLFDG